MLETFIMSVFIESHCWKFFNGHLVQVSSWISYFLISKVYFVSYEKYKNKIRKNKYQIEAFI